MKKLVLFVWIIFSFLPMEAEILSTKISPGSRDLLAIRVEFQEDIIDLTTGNGKFMINEWTDHDTTYVLDALPHDRAYFASHLTFINNYWNAASNGNIGINTDNDMLIPADDKAYSLSNPMRYYANPDSLDYRLAELIYETVMIAVDSGEYIAANDGLVIYHAGAGQDFKIDLDDSPFDIPSFYFDENYLSEYLSQDEFADLLAVNGLKGVVLPESQNQLKVNIALNGTEILLTGMLLGLPTLYDTEFGRSGAGTYGLMDQGSNTGSGLCPIKPSAFERYLLGSAEPVDITKSQFVTLKRDEVYKLPISSNEYFLVEYRKNTGLWADSLMWARDDVEDYLDVLRVFDSLGLVDYTMENGVLTELSDLDLGLPTDGVLIWHIVEPVVFGENPNAQDNWFLNLVEADGGDDIGKYYSTFDPSVNNGWKWDTWFWNNPAYKDNNPASYKLQFTDSTYPNTRSKSGLATGLAIRDFQFYTDSVVIQVAMDSQAEYNFDGMVFDESTTAFDNLLPGKQLVGYKDSSLYLFDSHALNEIYQQDSAYVKGQVALLSYDNSLIQIVNSGISSTVSHLENVGGLIVLNESNKTQIDYPIDLEHVAILADTVFLPPLPVEDTYGDIIPREAYKLHINSWTLTEIEDSVSSLIPYVKNDKIAYTSAAAAAFMNGELIKSEHFSFRINDTLMNHINPLFYSSSSFLPLDYMPVYSDMYSVEDLIPLHMNNDGEFEILALTDLEGRRTLSAFNHRGALLNNYPVFENYTKIRVYELADSPMIAAYDPSGKIDVLNSDASVNYSLPAPVDAASFFIEQVSADTAWIVADGSIIPIPSSGAYWGYNGKDPAHSNAVVDYQLAVPVESDLLIKSGLIYNYPNPIENNRTKFRFLATGATHATINIYSLDGRFIRKIESPVKDQQWNEIPWFVQNEVSGVYIAKIEITDGTKTETYFVKPAILK